MWDLCLLMLIVIFDTLWITRGEAAHGSEHKERSNFIYLSATLKCHMEMERFVRDGFSEHPAIMPKLLRHIFETFVSRSDYQALATEVSELKTAFAGLKKSFDSLSTQMVRRGDRGGDGGESGPAQKRKQKRDKAKHEENALQKES